VVARKLAALLAAGMVRVWPDAAGSQAVWMTSEGRAELERRTKAEPKPPAFKARLAKRLADQYDKTLDEALAERDNWQRDHVALAIPWAPARGPHRRSHDELEPSRRPSRADRRAEPTADLPLRQAPALSRMRFARAHQLRFAGQWRWKPHPLLEVPLLRPTRRSRGRMNDSCQRLDGAAAVVGIVLA
jgi:hypothetical protein